MRVAPVVAMLVLAGCGWLGPTDPDEPDNRADSLEALATEMGWRAESFVVADDGTAYASRVSDGLLEIIGCERRGTEWHATMGGTWVGLGESNTVTLGEGVRGGTIIYGAAEPGTAQVVTDAPEAVGGDVTDGGWIVWSPDESLLAADDTVTWRFVEQDGSVVAEGSGWDWPFGSPFDAPSPES
jgi:hypothetical protein